MNEREIIEALKSKYELVINFIDEFYTDKPIESPAGKVKLVASEGGYDEGSNVVRVYHFTDHDIYLKLTGSYTSYEGYEFYDEWNSFTEVKPKKVEVIIYE